MTKLSLLYVSTEVRRITDPVAAAVEEAAEQSVFPAATAAVAVAPVPVSAAAAVAAANEETGEARVSIHVVPTAASTAAREATEWLVPEASAELAAAAAVAAVSVVIRWILQPGIPVATYPAIVHHLRALIT